jgi:hypothetical protein
VSARTWRLALAACALAWAGVARPAGAVPWSEAFAAERDTVVFFDAEGTLLRAPFSLATRETLWMPGAGQHLVRVLVGPDGGRLAWLTRGDDRDTTRLWVEGATAVGPRVRFFALVPGAHGRVHSEPDVPSAEDPDVRGARLVRAGPLMRRGESNTLSWTPDGRAVLFGYDGGVAAVPAGGGEISRVARVLAVDLQGLAPAPAFLLDAIVPRELVQRFRSDPAAGELSLPLEEDRPILDALELAHPEVLMPRGVEYGTFVLYPLPGHWRLFPASDLVPGRPRAQSAGTIWWASGRRVRAIRAHDPSVSEEARADGTILWLDYDASRRAVLWAGGRQVGSSTEFGGAIMVLLSTSSPIRAVLPSRDGARVGFVTRDSLVVWRRADGDVQRVALGGQRPTALFDGPAGWSVATSGHGGAPGLAMPGASGRLVAVETPRTKGGVFVASPGGAHILLFDPGTRPPGALQVLDVASGRWARVENPGLAGWEPLGRR